MQALRAFVAIAAFAAATSVWAYQVTGPVLEVTDTKIVVQKGKDKWELARTPGTKVVGDLKLAQLETPPLLPTGPRKVVPLGDYVVHFLDGTNGINATFNDTGGPLEVTGTLALNAARGYVLDGLIKPRADAPQELVDGLKIMTADPDAEGRRRLMLSGSL